MSKNFLFSVVTAAYNVELYLAEAIDSVIKQTIGFKKNIQLILVDDGSTDGTGAICDKYQKKYPENIVVIHKENGGVSSARNAGIEVATGKYINFLDADDKFSPESFDNVYNFFEQHYDETDIVTVPLHYFEGKTGGHYLNDKFKSGSRVVDLNDEYKLLLKHVNATFFITDVAKNYRFDTELEIGEDTKFCCDILSEKMQLGLFTKAIYWYRYRQQGQLSAIQNSAQNKNYYTAELTNCYEAILLNVKNKFGHIPNYFQDLILNELFWRLKNYTEKPDILTDEEWVLYAEKIKFLCAYFDDYCVIKHSLLWVDHKFFILYHKYNKYASLVKTGRDIALVYNDNEVARMANRRTIIEFINIDKDGQIHIEGYFRFVGIDDEEPVRIFVQCNRKKYECVLIDRNDKKRYRLDFAIYRDIGFSVILPSNSKKVEIKFGCIIRDAEVFRKIIQFGEYSPIGGEYKNSYYSHNGRIVKTKGNSVFVEPCKLRNKIKCETALVAEILKKRKYKHAAFRLYYNFFQGLRRLLPWKKKEYWLVLDRVNKADDNGEAFFEYMQNHRKREVKTEFLIHKNTPDYKRIKRYGKVVDILGKKHKLHYLKCDKVVASNGDEFAIRPFHRVKALRDITAKKKFVFLQHGVISNDLSGWLNKYNKNIYKFVTTTYPEYNSIFECKYFYEESNVILTGLPRYDKLYNATQMQIAIIPTWRQYLNGTNDGGVWTAIEHFEETDYFKFYNSLLNDSRLLNAAKEYGYKIVFLPHPNVYQAYIQLFNIPNGVEVLAMNTKYSGVFAESNLLLTDYSSVAFDFAYLRKPVVYSQFDQEMLLNGGHVYTKGYFEYEKDGFGEVCTDLDSTVKTLISYIKDGCKLKDEYAERIENTFPFNDKNNCERVFNAIYKSDMKSE